MATFISISGPSTTGKTSLIESLSTYKELQHIVFSPDMHEVVWSDLVDKGFFQEFTEISKDSDYLCTYIIRLIDHYNNYLEQFKDTDDIVILDGCWLDLSIYAHLNMWYTRIIKSVQEEILRKATVYDKNIVRIYITKADDKKYPVDKNRLRGKISTFRENRALEIRHYEIAKHFKTALEIPTSDITDASLFIIEDLKNLGYV